MIHVGCSGFSYATWRGSFYPQKLSHAEWLSYYASKFNTVELNNTFYRFPLIKMLKQMYDRVPDDFIFTVKAHRIITHTLRFVDVSEKIREFTEIVTEGIGKKLGCILLQCPPGYSYTMERLDDICRQVPHDSVYSVEFRNHSWWRENVFSALTKCGITFCNLSYPGLPESFEVTSDRFYLRMHGVPLLFESSYSAHKLKNIYARIPPGQESYIYFNNTSRGAAFRNAAAIRRKISSSEPEILLTKESEPETLEEKR